MGRMSIMGALAIVAVSTLAFAGIGGGIGWSLGTYSPGYYRSVFRNGDQPWFDPVAVGVGQGLTQGVAGGVVIGLALVAMFLWRDTLLRRQGEATDSEPRSAAGGGV